MMSLVAGGLLGLPGALYALANLDPSVFRQGFGCLLLAYGLYMLVSSYLKPWRARVIRLSTVSLVGFAGGVVGGMTAMPGAVPTLWCDLHGISRVEQRGIVQPFMLVTQIAAVLLLLRQPADTAPYWTTFALVLPAVAAGTWFGLWLFTQADARVHRRTILVLLTLSGGSLML